MGETSIEWTDVTWNPTRGCRRVSPGCERCYAERMANRLKGNGMPYAGLVTLGKNGPRWTGDARFVPDALALPLHWRKPRRIFVDSMSDLFFEGFTNEEIAAVFGVMAACPRHTFQVLTKRPDRAIAWFRWISRQARSVNDGRGMSEAAFCLVMAQRRNNKPELARNVDRTCAQPWPLPNVWIGVSVEDQQRANDRVPLLLQVPAATRFVSYEPALGPVDFCVTPAGDALSKCDDCAGDDPACETCCGLGRIDWIIVGGESGPNARPFNPEWAADIVRECADAEVPVFVKQMGSNPTLSDTGGWGTIRNGKGGDMSEWPHELRVRQMPGTLPGTLRR